MIRPISAAHPGGMDDSAVEVTPEKEADGRSKFDNAGESKRHWALLIALASIFCVLAALAIAAWFDTRELTDEDIATAPPGCVADSLRVALQTARQPLQWRHLQTIVSACKDERRQRERESEAALQLKRQRDAALPRPGN